MRWTILTPELPPACGGVGDYTAQVAGALADAGEEVLVCVPADDSRRTDPMAISGVEIVQLPDRFGRSSRGWLDTRLRARPSRVLVQLVPGAFGLRGANLPFARWLLRRSQSRRDPVTVMFHEPYFYFTWRAPHLNLLAAAQRAMAAMLLRAADEVCVSTSSWHRYLSRFAPSGSAPFVTLPIPSSIPRHAATELGRAEAPAGRTGRKVIGHFGTYGAHVAPLLRPVLAGVLQRDPSVTALCLGAGSDLFVESFRRNVPALSDRVHATGLQSAGAVAAALAGCDLMIQPYPDGVTTRRTSVMACLTNGRPVLTTDGPLTELVWRAAGAVALERVDPSALVQRAVALLDSPAERASLGARGESLYGAHFTLDHTVRWLLRSRASAAA